MGLSYDDLGKEYLTGVEIASSDPGLWNISFSDCGITAMPYDLTGYNIINGTPADETLVGTIGKDAIYSNGGIDTLNGSLGQDILFGAASGHTTFQYAADALWAPPLRSINSGDPGGAGPNTAFSLAGYAQSQDVFVGVGTNNTLVMGDGKSALILEDTMSPDAGVQRLFNIDTIVLGNGGQLVDLTSTTISYGSVTVIGGTGDDIVMANTGADVVSGGDGKDYLWGGSGNDTLYGGNGDDRILGGIGDDILDGGTGKDTMTGGAGDDVYFIDVTGETITELANQGADRVESLITYTLGRNVENLTLLGTAAINGTGNVLDNIILGNAANNVLTGGGGNDMLNGDTGDDRMIGGAGNDTYIVDSTGDTITEGLNRGTDLVNSSITHTLGANVENLTLTGMANINASGNILNNAIVGNAGDNVIDAGDGADKINAGAGSDTVSGGNGNDSMFGEDGNDVLNGGAGIDNLNGGADEDRLYGGLEKDGLFGGGANDQLCGEDGDDILYGDGGNDVIVGGRGSDYMAGGQLQNGYSFGNDTFVWARSDVINTNNTQAGFDKIIDFGVGDRLDFSEIFSGQPPMDIHDAVHVTDVGNGTVISLYMGAGIGYFDVVKLEGFHADSVDDLLDMNGIVV